MKIESKNQCDDNTSELYSTVIIIVTSIPSEIKRRGNKAVEVYLQALNEGKEKIPYCSMLILGREEVGKTSLFRQLVGKPFLKDIKRTQGIDNSTVETFERRNVNTGEWVMKEDGDQSEQFGNALAGEFMNRLPDRQSKGDKNVSKSDLLSQLEKIPSHAKPLLPQKSGESDNVMSTWRPKTLVQDKNPSGLSHSKLQLTNTTEHSLVATTTGVKSQNLHLELSSSATPKQSDNIPAMLNPSRESSTAPPKQSDNIPAMLNPRESSKLNQTVMRSMSYVRKEPEPCLNVKDFAGQVVYRPMHHCYINRQAIYVVVFKLPDMLEYIHDHINSKYNPLDDICYWMRSIHAHTSNYESEISRRVLLVGTYRGQLPDVSENVKEIDNFIEINLICDSHDYKPYVDYVYPTYDSPSACRFFIPVENSIDIVSNPESYLQESGTKYVQETIKAMSKSLPHFNEQYPIKWLKFEEYLQEQCEARKSTPVMKIEEAKELAVKSGITDEQQQELALQFFNDTGKLNWLSKCIIK